MIKLNTVICTIGFLLQIFDYTFAAKRDSVIHIGSEDEFKSKVLKGEELWLVEFYAPWCGHCKNLAPEWEKAAGTLKGAVKVAAVDATQLESLAQKYQIQGFPTIKVFGEDKKKPTDYQGQRTADAIATEGMKALNQMIRDRKKGKTSSSGGSSSSSGSGSGSKKKAGGSGGPAVIELTDMNFNALVMESNDHWIVEFFAPWCGHCKNLAPEYESAASQLKGQVKLGAVDATVHQSIAQRYGVKGYPTLKLFPAGAKGEPKDYQGPRDAGGIVDYALRTLDEAGVAPSIPQLTNKNVFAEACAETGKICAIMFVPHILDADAKTRNGLLDTLGEVAKSFRGKPMSFVWTEAGTQTKLETALGLTFGFPTIAVMSAEKKVFAVHRLSWSLKNIKGFLNGVLSGTERTYQMEEVPKVEKATEWDGKDGVLEVEEISLDELFAD
mmetsp:Transcript_29699/g.30103  ORF Transcript_29699/g.30103 Transcript_29699/m.30103 type:complete len:441 (+) Transcript_29699:56-1378(+)|eukprot:CAMPEP_0182427892 /NCGR_PEP_ID=MMETSP1167-20130531/20629_1 /TAXON_ID=2988 /ORGANISM="Mallomonas Sp, Strain CCMP3275" /LENGTH=440 /DNA_ID=CAMNT_0024610465 /DNA_START=54 /DNA_END=1376 /DNA_ORIENTATION=-